MYPLFLKVLVCLEFYLKQRNKRLFWKFILSGHVVIVIQFKINHIQIPGQKYSFYSF